MSELTLKIYADKACTKPINEIAWKNEVELTSVTGEKIKLPQTAKGGEKAEAEIWIRNESHYDYIITDIEFPDLRVKTSIDTGWLLPNSPVKIQLSFLVPKNPTPEDRIKSGKLIVAGYYVYK